MRSGLLRLLGAATCAYGVATACRPGLLARPSGLVDADGRVDPHLAVVVQPLAWRDAASGLAMLVAPQGPALVTAAAVRIASDVGDAALLGADLLDAGLPGRVRRAGVAATALGWAALTVAALTSTPDAAAGPRPRL